jgi:hypothetical protein
MAMAKSRIRVSVAAAAFLAAQSVACSNNSTSGSSSNPAAPGGTGGSTSSTVSIRLTDSPFSDAKALLVTFSDVSIHQADPGDWKTIPFASGASRTCDLKKLNGATDVLGVGALASGKYTQIRLNVASATLYFDNPSAAGPCAPQIAAPAGRAAPVDVPSGEVKLNNEFTVSGSATTITLDFDGDQSVRQTGSGNGNGNGNNTKYMMVPVIRIVSIQ